MNKTIRQALIDEVHFPLQDGFVENKLIARGLNPDDTCTPEVLRSKDFKGAYADCLYSLIEAPGFSEADISVSLGDKELILKKVNSIYKSIGEAEVTSGQMPMVYMGSRR